MLVRGATGHFVFTLNNQAGPIDLTDSSVVFIFRRNEFETPVEKNCIIKDPLAGNVSVVLTPTELSEAGTYYYQLKITFPDNTVMRNGIATFYVEESLA